MKEVKYIIRGVIIIFLIILIDVRCTHKEPPIKETVYVPVKDTITEKENITKIIHLQRELELTRDSLNMVRDSLGEDLFIANYKLARIKKYNQIAAKGNNIRFLRGWINRTLNE